MSEAHGLSIHLIHANKNFQFGVLYGNVVTFKLLERISQFSTLTSTPKRIEYNHKKVICAF